MTSYVLTQDAEADLQQLTKNSVDIFGVRQTRKYTSGLIATMQKLAQSPKMGKRFGIIEEQEMRHFPYESHSLYYIEDGDTVLIVRILHRGMLPEQYLPLTLH